MGLLRVGINSSRSGNYSVEEKKNVNHGTAGSNIKNEKVLSIFLIIILISISSLNLVNFNSAAPRAANSSSNLNIEYLRIDVLIDNNWATTNIQEKFKNPYNYSINETFEFEIPTKAFMSNFSLTINNVTHYAKIVPKKVGQQKFNESVKKGMNAGLVEYRDKQIFTYQVNLAPYNETIVGLRYEQFIEKSLGGYEYVIPFSGSLVGNKIKRVSINVIIKSKLNVSSVLIDNYTNNSNVSYISSKKAKVVYVESSSSPTEDFYVNYQLATLPVNGTMMNYNDGSKEFFLHVFSPRRTKLGKAMPKEIIFVLDESGSMSGTKISQLKSAFKKIVNDLETNDTFNIVTFDSTISKYKSGLIGASATNKSTAITHINSINAGGGTNINDAMLTALKMFSDTETKMPIIVMLTDGVATAGVTDTSKIRQNVKAANTADASVFCLGFGWDVNFAFLKAMSLENNGIAIRIYQNSDASKQITHFYKTISTPLLRRLNFSYSTGTFEVYPSYVEQLFEGTEIAVLGKYNNASMKITATVNAKSHSGNKTFRQTFRLNYSTNDNFIPRLWAYTKIRYLLDQIAVTGETTSLVENVTKLALTYSFVTPYTSLLVEILTPQNDNNNGGGEGESEAEAECEGESEAEGEAEGEGEGEGEAKGESYPDTDVVFQPEVDPDTKNVSINDTDFKNKNGSNSSDIKIINPPNALVPKAEPAEKEDSNEHLPDTDTAVIGDESKPSKDDDSENNPNTSDLDFDVKLNDGENGPDPDHDVEVYSSEKDDKENVRIPDLDDFEIIKSKGSKDDNNNAYWFLIIYSTLIIVVVILLVAIVIFVKRKYK
jgi:Mg-chelatase subunit ChlD